MRWIRERLRALGRRLRASGRALGVAIRDLAILLRENARHESRRRRVSWAAVAALMVIGPLAFNLAREPGFTASVQIFPRPVGPFPAATEAPYYGAFLRDPELRRQVRLNVGRNVARYEEVSIAPHIPAGSLLVTVRAPSPTRARDFVNALGPQLAGATRRELAELATREVRRLKRRLRAGGLTGAQQRIVRRRLRDVVRLSAAPPERIVVGPRAPLPRLDRWADRVADSMPGDFPGRPNPELAALAGLLVVATLWAIGLALVPPAGARSGAAAGAAQGDGP